MMSVFTQGMSTCSTCGGIRIEVSVATVATCGHYIAAKVSRSCLGLLNGVTYIIATIPGSKESRDHIAIFGVIHRPSLD